MSQIPSPLHPRIALLRCDRGQTMAEYTVVLCVITLAIVIGIATLSGDIADTITDVAALF